MMKIAFINLGRHYGGVEVYVLSLIKAWTAKGNDCVVLAALDSLYNERYLCRILFSYNVEVRIVLNGCDIVYVIEDLNILDVKLLKYRITELLNDSNSFLI